MKGKVASISHM